MFCGKARHPNIESLLPDAVSGRRMVSWRSLQSTTHPNKVSCLFSTLLASFLSPVLTHSSYTHHRGPSLSKSSIPFSTAPPPPPPPRLPPILSFSFSAAGLTHESPSHCPGCSCTIYSSTPLSDPWCLTGSSWKRIF